MCEAVDTKDQGVRTVSFAWSKWRSIISDLRMSLDAAVLSSCWFRYSRDCRSHRMSVIRTRRSELTGSEHGPLQADRSPTSVRAVGRFRLTCACCSLLLSLPSPASDPDWPVQIDRPTGPVLVQHRPRATPDRARRHVQDRLSLTSIKGPSTEKLVASTCWVSRTLSESRRRSSIDVAPAALSSFRAATSRFSEYMAEALGNLSYASGTPKTTDRLHLRKNCEIDILSHRRQEKNIRQEVQGVYASGEKKGDDNKKVHKEIFCQKRRTRMKMRRKNCF